MSLQNTITLSTGAKMPQIGLGTWQSEKNQVGNAVEHAVRHGYRHLDLAMIYQNQEEIGRALKKVIPSVVKREDLFITSKLWNSAHRPDLVEKELDETLNQLGLEYLDLYLIHWPVSFVPGNKEKPFFPPHPLKKDEVELDLETSCADTWKAMNKLIETGKVKTVGVSNLDLKHLKQLVNGTGIAPVVNQVEAHPHLPQDELVAYCKEKNIHITAYSPLGNNSMGIPLLTEHPVIRDIAKKLGATEAQVLIAWGCYRGYSVIPKSVHNERIESNFKQIELSADDYATCAELDGGKHMRFNIPISYQPKWDINVFNEEVEKEASHSVKIV